MPRRKPDNSQPSTSSDGCATSRSGRTIKKKEEISEYPSSSSRSSSSSAYEDSDEEFKTPRRKRNNPSHTEKEPKNKKKPSANAELCPTKDSNAPDSNPTPTEPKAKTVKPPKSQSSNLDAADSDFDTEIQPPKTKRNEPRHWTCKEKRIFEKEFRKNQFLSKDVLAKLMKKMDATKVQIASFFLISRRQTFKKANGNFKKLPKQMRKLHEVLNEEGRTSIDDNEVQKLSKELDIKINNIWPFFVKNGLRYISTIDKKERNKSYKLKYEEERALRRADQPLASHQELFKKVQFPGKKDLEKESEKTKRPVKQIKQSFTWLRSVAQREFDSDGKELPSQMKVLHEMFTKKQHLTEKELNDLKKNLKMKKNQIVRYFVYRREKDITALLNQDMEDDAVEDKEDEDYGRSHKESFGDDDKEDDGKKEETNKPTTALWKNDKLKTKKEEKPTGAIRTVQRHGTPGAMLRNENRQYEEEEVDEMEEFDAPPHHQRDTRSQSFRNDDPGFDDYSPVLSESPPPRSLSVEAPSLDAPLSPLRMVGTSDDGYIKQDDHSSETEGVFCTPDGLKVYANNLRYNRVQKHGPEYEDIPLPFNHSNAPYTWSDQLVKEFACQFMPLEAVRVIPRFGKKLAAVLCEIELPNHMLHDKRFEEFSRRDLEMNGEETFTRELYDRFGEYLRRIEELKKKADNAIVGPSDKDVIAEIDWQDDDDEDDNELHEIESNDSNVPEEFEGEQEEFEHDYNSNPIPTEAIRSSEDREPIHDDTLPPPQQSTSHDPVEQPSPRTPRPPVSPVRIDDPLRSGIPIIAENQLVAEVKAELSKIELIGDEDLVGPPGTAPIDRRLLRRDRVWMHGEEFADIPLPFNSSIAVELWNHQQILEFVCQFMPPDAVKVFQASPEIVKWRHYIKQGNEMIFNKLSERDFDITKKRTMTLEMYEDFRNYLLRIEELRNKKKTPEESNGFEKDEGVVVNEYLGFLKDDRKDLYEANEPPAKKMKPTKMSKSETRQSNYSLDNVDGSKASSLSKEINQSKAKPMYSERQGKTPDVSRKLVIDRKTTTPHVSSNGAQINKELYMISPIGPPDGHKVCKVALDKDKVTKLGEDFREIPLPFDHSTDFLKWTVGQIEEFASQFLFPIRVLLLRELKVQSYMLGMVKDLNKGFFDAWEKGADSLNMERMTWEEFKMFGENLKTIEELTR